MISLREAWGKALVELGREVPELVVLDGDLANSTRADLFDQAFPERFLQMGIAEQNLVGVAAGLAHSGLIPWLSSFAVFFTHRALDPLRMLVAQTEANVKIGAGYAGLLTGRTGKTHQDVEDLAIMRAMPKMAVLAPADPEECRWMTRWATFHLGPVYLRLARDPEPDLPPAPLVPGRPRLVRPGGSIALVSTGVQSVRTLEAARLLAEAGVDARVIHLGWLKPLDTEALLEMLEGVEWVVTVEEHSVIGGLGGLIAELLSARRPTRILRIGIQDDFGESASNQALLERHGLSSNKIAQRVLEERIWV